MASASIPATIKGGTADIDTVLNVAVTIYCEWMAQKISLHDNESQLAEWYAAYSKKYTDFMRAYPLPFRYIISLKYFSAKVFKKYLQLVAATMKTRSTNSWKTRDEFLESQAVYDRMMYMEMQPNATPVMVDDRYNEVLSSLIGDWNAVETATANAASKYDNDQAILISRIKRSLIEQSTSISL